MLVMFYRRSGFIGLRLPHIQMLYAYLIPIVQPHSAFSRNRSSANSGFEDLDAAKESVMDKEKEWPLEQILVRWFISPEES